MYKRRKRRASNKKGKKQAAVVAMSVTTMEVDNHQTLPVQIQPESKAVGARKRKPTTISKIVEKPLSDLEVDYSAADSLSAANQNNNNNNNFPPYKKPCLEPGKNGIIRNILTELKSAKEASNRLDIHVLLKDSGQEREEDERGEDDNGVSVSEGENSLRIEEDEDDEGFSYDGYGNERTKSGGRARSFPGHKKRSVVDYSMNRRSSRDKDGEKSDLADIKSILSNTGVGFGRSNGIGAKYVDPEGDDSTYEEGIDLRNITGNSTGDDELPFRCGVCAYGSCDKSTLLRHMRTHSGERPFQCRLCYFAFTTKANCERHLRNRHFQVDRDQLRNLVVCLPTSSNGSESETESNHGVTQNTSPIIPAQMPVPLVNNSIVTGTIHQDEELPLDLSMDAVDLSTKRRDGNSIFGRRSSLHRPRPVYPAPEVTNLLVTSPFVSKREPLVHPQLPINNPFTPHSLSQSAAAPGSRAAFSLFPFGAPPGFNPFGLPPANVEKLISMGAGSPPKMSNPFLGASPTLSYGSKESVTAITEKKEVIVKTEPVENKRTESNANSVSSVSPTANSRKRSDNSNGEYQKPKQRRYRTERPFACPHCPARFTLRSNMERHGKHQHPTVWQRSPSNRVINRQKNQQSPLVGPPTMVHPNKYNSSSAIDAKNEKNDGMNVNVRAVIAQQLKRKLSNSSLRNNGNGSETETDAENTMENGKMSGGDDLASVERLLDRVKTSNFAQYFNDEGNNNNDNNSEDNDDRSCDDSGGEGMSGSEPEEGDSKTSGGEKKKSAYSSAPHKISCPHCSRRFPWTSSLRRHLLTHTGQKPYQCPKCPLLFTTKSNCDRHLARKHNGQNVKNASDNSTEEDDEEEEGEEDHEEGEEEEGDDPAADNEIAENEIADTMVTPVKNTATKTPASNGPSPGEDAAFRCHLCDAAAGEREILLSHMEEEHKETFHMLVSKGALSSSPPSENSETEQVLLDQKDVTHRKVMCVFCVRRFWSVEDLRRHIRSHSGERPFSCPHCSRRFTLKHSMLRHLKKHSNSSTPTGSKIQSSALSSLKNSDLIGRLLGINDDRLVEQLLNKPDAKDAAKILGLGNSQSQPPAASTSTATKAT